VFYQAAVTLKRPMPLAVDRYELGPVATNCYVVRSERGASQAVLVDPGDDATRLRLELARAGASCAAILITHTHYDHIGAVADLAEGTSAHVCAPAGELEVLERPNDFYASVGVSIRPWTPEHLLQGGEELDLAGIAFEVVPVPGHSPAHLAYHADGCLFSGDVLFAGSVGRTDLPGASWDTLLGSIRTLTERYPPETVVYSGHGPPTTLGAELARNPFLAELRVP
jgi:glyoxylase-like metal-dependent hydrolase (beta-lactamase superfamily II)